MQYAEHGGGSGGGRGGGLEGGQTVQGGSTSTQLARHGGGGGGDGGLYGVTSGLLHITHVSARLQSGTVALALVSASAHEMHWSAKRHGGCAGGGAASSSVGPSKLHRALRLKTVE